jgi:hypothetical protein
MLPWSEESVPRVSLAPPRADCGWRAVEGLAELHLADVLGHGGSGVVLRGTLGTVPVAVKVRRGPRRDARRGDEVGSAARPAANPVQRFRDQLPGPDLRGC